MHSPKWTPPLWLLMLRLASSTTGWMSEVSYRQWVWNNPPSRAESTYSVMAQWEIYGKKKVWLLRGLAVKIYCAHSCRDQPVSSVTAGVQNVLLQCYIFISAVYVGLYVSVCLRPLPYRAVLSWHGLNSNREEGTAASVHSRCLPCVSFWLLAWLPLCLFSAGTFN